MLGCMEHVGRTAISILVLLASPSGSRVVDAASRLQKNVMMVSSSHLLPSPASVAPTYAPCKLLRRVPASERAGEEDAAAAEAVIACTTSATDHFALRHGGAATSSTYNVWMNEAFALPGNQPKAPLGTSTEMALGCTRVARCGPFMCCYCVPHVHAYAWCRGGPGFNLKANAFTSLH